MSVVPTVTFGSIGDKVIPKIATRNISLIPSLRGPPINHAIGLDTPRYIGLDLTGSLFGLAGYYAQTPVWRKSASNFLTPFQFAGFQSNAGVAYSLKSAANMLAAASAPSFPQYIYMFSNLDRPGAFTPGEPVGTSIPGGLLLHNYNNNSNTAQSYCGPVYSKFFISAPNLIQADTDFIFSAKETTEQMDVSGYMCSNDAAGIGYVQPPSFVAVAPMGGLTYAVNFGGTIGGLIPGSLGMRTCQNAFPTSSLYYYSGIEQEFFQSTGAGFANPYDGNNPHSSYTLPKYYPTPEGKLKTIWNGLVSFGSDMILNLAKVHAGSGNFLRGYMTQLPVAGVTWYGGNIWCNADDFGNIAIGESFTAHLSDPVDDALFQISGTKGTVGSDLHIQQMPGGGFAVWDNTNYQGILFLIAFDFSGYVRVNMSGLNYGLYTPDEEHMSIDAAGFVNVIQTLNGNYNGSLYSGPAKTTVYLSGAPLLSPVSSWATICRNQDKCGAEWEA